MPLPYFHNKAPKINWHVQRDFLMEGFELGKPYSATSSDPYFWNNFWTEYQLPSPIGTDPFGIGGTSLAGGSPHGGATVMGLYFISAALPDASSIYIERVFGGFTPGQTVSVSVWVMCPWALYDGPFTGATPTGIRIVGGTTALYSVTGWQKLVATGTADGSGNITVHLGMFNTNLALSPYPDTANQRVYYFDDLSLPAPSFVGPSTDLFFGYPARNARSWPQPDAGSASMRYDSGLEDAWIIRNDQLLQLEVLSIPPVDGTTGYGTISGWDKWRQFLEQARTGTPFTFYPNKDDVGSAVSAILVEPKSGAPAAGWEQSRTLTLTLKRADGLRWAGY